MTGGVGRSLAPPQLRRAIHARFSPMLALYIFVRGVAFLKAKPGPRASREPLKYHLSTPRTQVPNLRYPFLRYDFNYETLPNISFFHILFYAIMFAGWNSGFRARFWQKSSRKSIKNGPPASRRTDFEALPARIRPKSGLEAPMAPNPMNL